MAWLKREIIEQFLAARDYDIRKSHNARWVDQKCTPDVIRMAAECIIEFAEHNPDDPFKSVDVWRNLYTKNLVESFFKKPNPDEPKARNEYDKFFQQPMELLSYAGVLRKLKFGQFNYYEISDRELLDFISLSDRNSLTFLQLYLTKVLQDSGLLTAFTKYFTLQTTDAYFELKDRYAEFTMEHTPINGVTECNRIFTKVLNPLAFAQNKHGTEKGRFSKDVITLDALMYNRSNFRDDLAGKPKGKTRRQHAESQPNILVSVDSSRAKRVIRAHNNAFRQGKTEVLTDGHGQDKAIHAHHIFPESQFPQIASFYENLIALTPTQHMSYAHPSGHTQRIDRAYQFRCILAKIDTIRQAHNDPEIDNIYDFDNLVRVLAIGLADDEFLEVPINNYEQLLSLVETAYQGLT